MTHSTTRGGGMDQWMSSPIQFKANYPYSPPLCPRFTLIVPDHVMFDFVAAGAERCLWAASTSCLFSSPGWWSTSTTASSTKRYAEFTTIVCLHLYRRITCITRATRVHLCLYRFVGSEQWADFVNGVRKFSCRVGMVNCGNLFEGKDVVRDLS